MLTTCAIGMIWALSQGVAPEAPRPGGFEREFDGMMFVWIPDGRFTMGTDTGYFDERPARKVHITKGFWLGKYEVSQEEWEAVMGANPSTFEGDNLPVETITHTEAIEFCEKLSEKTGAVYRLPTEAEWEYACNAGTHTKYNFGDDKAELGDHAWYDKNSDGTTHPRGTKERSPWYLHDMHGNVAEWCSDWYVAGYDPEDTTDPQGPEQVRDAVIRGGGWSDSAGYLRTGARFRLNFIFARSHIGLRVVREDE